MEHDLIWAIWTVVVLVIFVAIFIWAWSGKRKKEFEEAANIPFDEDKPVTTHSPGEKDNG